MNTYIGLFIGIIILFRLLYKIYRIGAKMRLTLVLYLGILMVDLLVGGCLVVWSCVVRDDPEECSLAVGGAVGSVVMLSLIMLLCPLYMEMVLIVLYMHLRYGWLVHLFLGQTKWSVCEVVDSIREVIKRNLKHMKSQHKGRQLLMEGQQLLATKSKKSQRFISLDENKNDVIVPDSNVSIVPAGRGPVRGVPYTTISNTPNRSEVKVKYTEVNET